MRALILLFLISLAAPVLAAEPSALSRAMVAVRADRWAEARQLARPAGQVALDIVEWRRLRAGEGRLDDYRAFLARNPDWPGLDKVRTSGEGAIGAGDDPAAVVAFFGGRAPVTGEGALRLVEAEAALGRTGEARAAAVAAWQTLPLSEAAQSAFLARFGRTLAGQHVARLDTLLWEGHDISAGRMLSLVPEGWQKLAAARIALRNQDPGVDARIAAVPTSLRNDPGLAYERFMWRTRKGRGEDAIALLDERSASAQSLGRPALWAGWRRYYAHQVLREGNPKLAYRLASRHHLSAGASYAELEWLSGFIALRFLDRPETALTHFRAFEAAVRTPISLGRAGYWEGRALEAMRHPQEARAAYAMGAQFQTGFYGLLSAERGGIAMDPSLAGHDYYPDWRAQPFARSSVIAAAFLLHEAGEKNLVEMFLTHLAESADPAGQRALAGLALELNDHHVALRIAKTAAETGNVMVEAYFPVTEIARTQHPVPTELVLSIVRRESEFDPSVASGAGALGLMQLMPTTAKAMADELSVRYSSSALTADPSYNARLGAAYLAHLVEEFGPNPVLVAAAYNAGPSRAHRWVSEQGDPRAAGVDVIDWIELIPFTETRNYVMRVTEALPIYRARLAGQTGAVTLSKELKAN
ncbi:lytic transglycosylase domain-containing protein [Rhodovulum visakhapatnamense]|uniref:Lytic transglycosylase domain-containing protein n=1 Tax=Rhodovulum visakhapatnamense TaxID=364297 RepID=A0ABS1RCN5_9RHOB|nr:lytic transglycosylase domain-containing protein [Rhodovulum visakhapatnamense]MBL3571382.1 lytic transglycosylase domain-containing protein [Rhodovulum visakhapatnamense]MBL3577393.1 lytic transglycosylase domain-containing protein [Rhodovulum visakhapatnamense]